MAILEILDTKSIENSLKMHKAELELLGVDTIYLFGSVARKEAKENSDIDFLIKFKPGMKNFDNFMNLSFLFEEVFKVKMDILTTESISDSFRDSIERDSVLIEI